MGVTYRGKRVWGEAQVYVDTDGEVNTLRHVVHHSPTGFEWGYAGSGPAELARCILLDALHYPKCGECQGAGCWYCDGGYDLPPVMYQQFKFDIVARWPQDGWELEREEVLRWVATHRQRLATE